MDGCSHNGLDALDELLQDQLLVLGLDQVEEVLDAIEVWAVRRVEDWLCMQLLASLRNLESCAPGGCP